jgi:hypothetical protein
LPAIVQSTKSDQQMWDELTKNRTEVDPTLLVERAVTTINYLLCGNPLSDRGLRSHFHPEAECGHLTTQRIEGIRKRLAI